MLKTRWTRQFTELGIEDVPLVGGKNASLGEMTRELGNLGVSVPEGYAVTAEAYRHFLDANGLTDRIDGIMAGLDKDDVGDLTRRSREVRNLILSKPFPEDLERDIVTGYEELSSHYGVGHTDVAIRSSATAEDLPTASFAGQQESFLNVHGDAQLLESVKKCFASLFTLKTNEYAHLLGGTSFEPHEENPMLGWRGASRYYHPDYKEGFMLELRAVKRVREEFGLKNLKVMVPFCRTPEEGQHVLDTMREGGLTRGEDGLEVYVMAEIPSNVVLAKEFAAPFDGFSIGSNDLTQLVLGVDRDSERVAPLFDERDEAVKRMCATLIEEAHAAGKKVGICGQAPSDYPDFAVFLVENGIDSIRLTPDSVVPTTMKILEVEKESG